MSIKSDKIWMDGRLVNFEDANVHVLTHTLHYGYGAFEGIRAYRREDGQSHILRLQEHIKRLFESAHILGLKIPFTPADLIEACVITLRANNFDWGYLRPLVFMGSETMGLGATGNTIHVAIPSWQWGAYLGSEALKNGIRATVSSFSRSHINANMVKGKICGQYVNSVIAKRDAMTAGYDEAIMLDTNGYVSECTGENIFVVKNQKLITPPYGSSILGGITRQSVIDIAHDLGVTVEERTMTRDELYVADEIFLCGTAAEVTPVREIDGRDIGPGRPGEISSMIASTYFDIVKGSSPAHPEWRYPYSLA
ncbi:MAG: branched chain amino acid aminotransferase [Myxococcales bacterium]|mgnify:CR=1 FL=1|nr:branched chain amino acid aminotransferase [Myxococcales bacterium]